VRDKLTPLSEMIRVTVTSVVAGARPRSGVVQRLPGDSHSLPTRTRSSALEGGRGSPSIDVHANYLFEQRKRRATAPLGSPLMFPPRMRFSRQTMAGVMWQAEFGVSCAVIPHHGKRTFTTAARR
jgi:hypothetical protein